LGTVVDFVSVGRRSGAMDDGGLHSLSERARVNNNDMIYQDDIEFPDFSRDVGKFGNKFRELVFNL
jgi:hypothetical protein